MAGRAGVGHRALPPGRSPATGVAGVRRGAGCRWAVRPAGSARQERALAPGTPVPVPVAPSHRTARLLALRGPRTSHGRERALTRTCASAPVDHPYAARCGAVAGWSVPTTTEHARVVGRASRTSCTVRPCAGSVEAAGGGRDTRLEVAARTARPSGGALPGRGGRRRRPPGLGAAAVKHAGVPAGRPSPGDPCRLRPLRRSAQEAYGGCHVTHRGRNGRRGGSLPGRRRARHRPVRSGRYAVRRSSCRPTGSHGPGGGR